MDFVRYWLNRLGQNDILFWASAVVFLILLLSAGFFIKQFGKGFFQSEKAQMIWSKIMNWIILFSVMIYTFSYLTRSSWMYETLFVLGDTSITPFLIFAVLFAIFIALRLSHTIRKNVLPGVYRRYKVERSVQATINTLLHYTIVLAVLLFALNSLGFNLTSLTVFAGVLGIGVGFGLRNIMNNFISGLIILFDRPIKVGDRGVIDGTVTDIEKIRIRNTIVHTRANERMVIPNSYFLEEKFINRSFSDRRLRVRVSLSVPYGGNLHLASQLMEEAVYELSESKWRNEVKDPKPKVFVEEFAEYDITMEVWFWIENQANELEFILPSEVRYLIHDKFNEQGVEFSFPRHDVYLLNGKKERKAD